jgi:hypothetical protein
MTMTDTGTDVENNLNLLKKAVSVVTKADKAWLSALETFFEGIDPKITDTTTTQGEINTKVAKALVPGTLPIDKAVRVVLDDVSFLQYTDKKLDARVSQSDTTPEDLGRAVVEAEAYLLLTNEAFVSLLNVGTSIVTITTTTGSDKNFENFKINLGKLNLPANSARTGLTSLVGTLLQQTTAVVKLPPTEPEGTDLLLGKKLNTCDLTFLEHVLPSTSKEFEQTVALLDFVTDQADRIFWVIAPVVAILETDEVNLAADSSSLEQSLSNERIRFALNNLLFQLNALADLSVSGGN